jgi:hypothetical protein
MKKLLLYICLFAICGVTQAGKIPVKWTNPIKNTDGTNITNLSHVMVEWGTCNGTNFGEFLGAMIFDTTGPGAQLSRFLITDSNTTGLTKICIRAYAYNTEGAPSDPSNIAIKDLLPTPGKPVTLGQPVIISFNQENR